LEIAFVAQQAAHKAAIIGIMGTSVENNLHEFPVICGEVDGTIGSFLDS
jgi:hypothetical protein